VIVHVDRLRGHDQRQALCIDARGSDQYGLDLGGRSIDCATDDLVGRAISAQCIDRDPDHAGRLRRVETKRLDVPALVRLAVRADAVHPLRLLARRADLEVRDRDPVLGATLVAA
jgi:hypothetical protein